MDNGQRVGLLARMSIAQKIILMLLVNVFVAATISVASIGYLQAISHELEQVAYEDFPLTRQITEISTHQLEQAVHLERALRYGELLALGQPTEKELEKEIEYFKRLTNLIKKESDTINNTVSEFLKEKHSEDAEKEFQNVLATMRIVDSGQAQIESLAAEVFSLLEAGELENALDKVNLLVEKEDNLDKTATDLLFQFEKFTAASMELATQHELEAKRNIILISLVSLFIASLLSWRVYRSVSQPLHHMKKSLTALEDGKTLSLPELYEGSELGRIYHSISIIGNNFDAINRTQAGIFLSVDGEIQSANSHFLSLIGYPDNELCGKPYVELMGDKCTTTAKWNEQWQTVVSGNPVSGEFQLRKKDGASLWVQSTINPIVGINGKTNRIVVYSQDITEEVKKRAEIAMISLVASKTDNSVVITDAQGVIEYVNEGFTRITGYPAEEAIGRKPGQLLQGKDTNKKTVENIRRNLAADEPFYDEILNYNKAGEAYWVSLSINPVFDDYGNLIRFISIQGDVTDNKLRNLENEEGMKEAVAVLNGLAQGKLKKTMTGNYEGTFKEITGAVNQTLEKLVDVVQRIGTVASTVNTAAREINSGNTDLARRSENAAARLEETATNMEEITSTVAQNASNSAQANELALGAHKEAEKGGAIVGQAVNAMVDINESSKRIVDIIGVIDDIAFQTNLLALNASVEAARAGEQGRGFSVVASEVRNLASRSAGAAKEIKELIGDSVKRVENGVGLVNQTGETLDSIVTQVKQVADIVAEIYSASKEQADGVTLIHSAIVEIDDSTQQNSALVEEVTAASKLTPEQVQQLIELIEFFDTGNGQASSPDSHGSFSHSSTKKQSANSACFRDAV